MSFSMQGIGDFLSFACALSWLKERGITINSALDHVLPSLVILQMKLSPDNITL